MTEIRDRRQKHWFWVDDAVIDLHAKALGPFGLALYMLLARHADRHGQSYPSLSRIQEELGGVSRNTVKKYLALLIERGLIAYEPRKDPDGDQTSHLYTILTVTKSPEPSVPKSNEIREGGRSTSDLPLSPSDSPEGVGQPVTGVGQPVTGVGQPVTYGRSTSDLRVGQPVTPKELGFEGRGSEGIPLPPLGNSGGQQVATETDLHQLLQGLHTMIPPDARSEAETFHTAAQRLITQLFPDWPVSREYWLADCGDGRRGMLDLYLETVPPIAIELDRLTARQRSLGKLAQIQGYRIVVLREASHAPVLRDGVYWLGCASAPGGTPVKEAPWGQAMTPEVARCGLCDYRGLVALWQADGTPVLSRCPHDPVAVDRRCLAHGFTRAPPGAARHQLDEAALQRLEAAAARLAAAPSTPDQGPAAPAGGHG